MTRLPAPAVAVLAGLLTTLTAVAASAAPEATHEKVELRAFVNDSCIIADEPFFIPAGAAPDGSQAKFLPLIGLVVGKLAELFINHELQGSAKRIKDRAARKDTHYAVQRQMNLYRATLDPAPDLAINANLGCMTVVAAGAFQPEPADCRSQYVPKELVRETANQGQSAWKTSRTDDSVENQLRRADVCVAGKARAVYEARFEFTPDGTAFRLKDAGYVVDSLLTTDDKTASRTTLYTLKVSDPGPAGQDEVLTSAWVDIGAVRAGARSTGGAVQTPWVKVPALSVEARRKYDASTRTYQELAGEIDALKRARSRNQRLLAGLDQRIAAAPPDIAAGLKQERLRIAVQDQEQDAELDARNAEYREMPHAPLEFMPVTIEVAVTETESEDKARLALADIIGQTSGVVASSVGSSATGLLSKTVATSDLKIDSGPDDADGALRRAHDAYFDAVVETQANAAGPSHDASQRRLTVAKQNYNEVRRSLGLEQIK